jgi:hypothetical protein
MSVNAAWCDLVDILNEKLFEGREDSEEAARMVASAIHELISEVIEQKTGAT